MYAFSLTDTKSVSSFTQSCFWISWCHRVVSSILSCAGVVAYASRVIHHHVDAAVLLLLLLLLSPLLEWTNIDHHSKRVATWSSCGGWNRTLEQRAYYPPAPPQDNEGLQARSCYMHCRCSLGCAISFDGKSITFWRIWDPSLWSCSRRCHQCSSFSFPWHP